MPQKPVNSGLQRGLISQIGDTDGAAAHLILIGGANAAPGGADLGHGILRLAATVQFAMDRQDQGRVFRNHQRFSRDIDTLFAHGFDFFDQMPGVQHDAIADH